MEKVEKKSDDGEYFPTSVRGAAVWPLYCHEQLQQAGHTKVYHKFVVIMKSSKMDGMITYVI